MTKKCTLCLEELPLTSFYPSQIGRFGVGSRCRECETKRQHQKYLKRTGKTETKVWKHTIEKCHEYAAAHGGVCLSTEYGGTKTLYHWRCALGHEWKTSLCTSVDHDRWCPKCASNRSKATCLLKYGNTTYNNREKSKQTCISKYGSASNMGSRDVALKNARARNNSYILSHWSTGEEIVCQGSYEKHVVDYLNTNKIDYTWQVPFALSNGKTYYIDFLDKSRNIYVEIKGFWREDARVKYDLWIQDNPSLSIEVWDKPKLKSLGILTRDPKRSPHGNI